MIQYDPKPDLNLLRIRFTGHVTKEEAEKGVDDATQCLTAMGREFRLLADLSTLGSMDVACAPSIERVMDLCQEHGIAEIVRIIPDPSRDIGLGIMSQFHYESSVRIFTCSSQEEAFKVLSTGGDIDPAALRVALA